MPIPLAYQISDTRTMKIFRTQTFCGYKKSNVFHIFDKSLVEGKVDEAQQWCIEIIVSGYIDELWERIIYFICKHINVANIRTISYIHKQYTIFQSIRELNNITEPLEFRNNQQFRNLMCEIVCILCKSKKCRLPNITKIKKEELRLEYIKDKLQAPSIINRDVVKINDPEEIKMISNEFLYSLQNKDFTLSLFWMRWMMEWERLYIKKLKKFQCAYRPQKGVDSQFCYDFVWLLWEIIYKEIQRSRPSYAKEYMCLYTLFCNKFKKTKKNKRLMYIVCIIKILFFSGLKEEYIIDDYNVVIRWCSQINISYHEKKQYENASKELEKQLKFNFIHRDDYYINKQQTPSQPTPAQNMKPKKLYKIKNTKPKNISTESYRKINAVMNTLIRNDSQDNSDNYFDCGSTYDSDTTKYITLTK